MAVEFQDFSIQVKDALENAVIQYLDEAGATLERQAANNTRIGTGETAGTWTHVVDEGKQECVIGNPLENAIWEEFGTGEFALGGDGRRGGWVYKDEDDGKFHHTYGKTPTRALHNAFVTKKSAIIARAEQVLKGRMG
jgi:hypothetical protein